jgi:hypothetical protein
LVGVTHQNDPLPAGHQVLHERHRVARRVLGRALFEKVGHHPRGVEEDEIGRA